MLASVQASSEVVTETVVVMCAAEAMDSAATKASFLVETAGVGTVLVDVEVDVLETVLRTDVAASDSVKVVDEMAVVVEKTVVGSPMVQSRAT